MTKRDIKLNLKAKMDARVNQEVDNLFTEAHQFVGTESGDITFRQAEKLDELKRELKALIVEQTMQNL